MLFLPPPRIVNNSEATEIITSVSITCALTFTHHTVLCASKNSFTFHFWHKSFVLDDVKLAELSNISFEWKNVTFLGVGVGGQNIFWPLLLIFWRSWPHRSGSTLLCNYETSTFLQNSQSSVIRFSNLLWNSPAPIAPMMSWTPALTAAMIVITMHVTICIAVSFNVNSTTTTTTTTTSSSSSSPLPLWAGEG